MPLSENRKYRVPSAKATPDLAAHLAALAEDIDADVAGISDVADAAASASQDAGTAASAAALRLELLDSAAVTSAVTSTDDLVIRSDSGEILLAIEELSGAPYFSGAPTPVARYIPEDSLEFRDDFGGLILAVDDLSGSPRLRGGSGGSGPAPGQKFTETHFIILAGQSNSQGVSVPSPAGTNETLPNLFTVPQRGANQGVQVQAAEPLAHPYGGSAGTVGHGWTVARRYALDNPGVRVVILPLAQSGSGFFLSSQPKYTWATSRIGEAGMTNLYTEAVNRANTAIAQQEGPSRVPLILWHQGESDAVGEVTKDVYARELDALIAGFRREITGASNAVVIVGQTCWEFRNVRKPGTYADIDAAHRETPSRVRRSGFAEAPGQGHAAADNTHFTGYGQKLLAENIYRQILPAHYNL